jgi:two-component system response regulator HydG
MENKILDRIRNVFNVERTRLLVIDDEEAIRTLFNEFFSKRGYDVTLAENIAEAEACLKNQSFDLVLLDITLPDGNGLASLRKIKSDEPDLPVIILTGLGYDEECFQQAIQNGASAYMSKFVPLNQVLMEIHRVLKSSKE